MSQIEDNQTAAGSVDDIVNFNLIFPLLQSYPVKFLTTCDTMDAFTAGPCFFKSCCQLLVVTQIQKVPKKMNVSEETLNNFKYF